VPLIWIATKPGFPELVEGLHFFLEAEWEHEEKAVLRQTQHRRRSGADFGRVALADGARRGASLVSQAGKFERLDEPLAISADIFLMVMTKAMKGLDAGFTRTFG